MERYLTIFLLAVPLGIIGVLIGFHLKARNMVKDWAGRNNYEIIKLRYRFFFKGPFQLDYRPKRQKIFYVKVIDDHGQIESAFVKCGDYWKGLIVDKVEVKWEKNFDSAYFRNKKLPG